MATGFYNLSTYDNYAYLTVNGITFGFLSYTQFTNGIPTPSGSEYGVIYLNQTDVIEKQISDMRPNCDVLVVSCHWGVEDSHDVTEQQRNTAQWLADQGVDLIIGTHPHVTQTAQWLTAADGTDAFVVYSLGNLISAQSKPDNMIGLILDITFQKTTAPDGTTNIQILDPSLQSHRHPIRKRIQKHPRDAVPGLYRRLRCGPRGVYPEPLVYSGCPEPNCGHKFFGSLIFSILKSKEDSHVRSQQDYQ